METIGLRVDVGYKSIVCAIHLLPYICDFAIELLLRNMAYFKSLDNIRLQVYNLRLLIKTSSQLLLKKGVGFLNIILTPNAQTIVLT